MIAAARLRPVLRVALALTLLPAVACDDKKEDKPAAAKDGDAKAKAGGDKKAGGDDKKAGDAKAPEAAAPKRPDAPAGLEGAKQVLAPFVAPGADYRALTLALRPEDADYAAVFEGEAAAKAKAAYDAEWDSGLALGHDPPQTEVLVWEATTEQMVNEPKGNVMKSDAKYFPGGYFKIVGSLKKGLKFYRFKFVEPGKELGMGYDGLVHVNGHWAVFPKPWRALGQEATDNTGKMFDSMSPYDMGKMLKEK